MPAKPDIVVIGASAGGLNALGQILGSLPADFPLPMAVVRHQPDRGAEYALQVLEDVCQLSVRQVEGGERPEPGVVHLAPPDMHLFFGEDAAFAVSRDEPVNFSRPAIDVLFKSAADRFGAGVAGVILTGANHDGAGGLAQIKRRGGLAIVQHPDNAEADAMPRAAIAATRVDCVLRLSQVGPFLWDLAREGRSVLEPGDGPPPPSWIDRRAPERPDRRSSTRGDRRTPGRSDRREPGWADRAYAQQPDGGSTSAKGRQICG